MGELHPFIGKCFGTVKIKHIKYSALLLAAFVLFFAVPVALAHANLVRSDPPANSAQKVAPKTVRLWFSEDIEHTPY